MHAVAIAANENLTSDSKVCMLNQSNHQLSFPEDNACQSKLTLVFACQIKLLLVFASSRECMLEQSHHPLSLSENNAYQIKSLPVFASSKHACSTTVLASQKQCLHASWNTMYKSIRYCCQSAHCPLLICPLKDICVTEHHPSVA